MGIRGLRSFLTKFCPDTLKLQDILTMASTHPKKTSGVATMVVDAPTCCFSLFEKMKVHCGGQFTLFKEIVQRFVDSFRQENIKLVFFFDGLISDESLERWYTKRTKDVKTMQKLMKEIKTGRYEKCETLTLHWVIIFFRLTLKALYKDDPLVEVYTAIETTRTLIIAKYAKDNNCFAILSDDTIFVILDTVPVMSCKRLDISTMTSVISDRSQICNQLQFKKEHLKIWALLADFDDDTFDDFFTFYEFVSNRRYVRRSYNQAPFFNIIKYIKRFGNLPYQEIVKRIAKDIEIHGSEALAKLFPEHLTDFDMERRNISYYRPNIKEENTPEFINQESVVSYFTKKVTTSDMFTMVLEVMTNGRVVVWTTPLQDEDDTSLIGHVELFRPIRQRFYGFIINSSEIETRNVSEVWLSLDCQNKEEHVDPILEPFNELSLTELWNHKHEIDVRMNILLKCFGFTPIDGEESFIKIPTKFQPLAIVLRYIFKHPKMHLSEWEIVSFVAQAMSLSDDNQEKVFESLDPRACHLAGVFIDGITMYLNVALCCCLDLQPLMPWNYFDGQKFQYFYQKMKLSSSASQLLFVTEDDEVLKEQLLSFIAS